MNKDSQGSRSKIFDKPPENSEKLKLEVMWSKTRAMDSPLKNLDDMPVSLMVIGPHRCGTSALSGVLSQLGMDLPATIMPSDERNAMGYFESQCVMAFNDKLLNVLGTDWKDLSPIDFGSMPTQVFQSLMCEAVQILEEEFSTSRIPLLKDPRICRLVGFWKEAFNRAGYRPLYVHIHRNPLEAAFSLKKRDAIPVELGLLIWLRHVLDAEAATRGETRVFTNYKALLDDWRTQVEQIEKGLGLTFHRNTIKVRQEIGDFLIDSLRHQHWASEELRKSAQVADVVREAFLIFESWVGSVGNPSDYDSLNALRHRLDGSLDQIATFVRAQERETTHAAKISELEGKLRQRSLEVDERFKENGQLLQSLNVLQEEKANLSHEHEEEQTRLQENLKTRDSRIRDLEKSVNDRFEEIKAVSNMLLDTQTQWEVEKTKLAEEQDVERASLQESLNTRDSQIRDLEKSVNDRFEEIKIVSNMLLDTQAQETHAREKVEALLSSSSWKITSPLRWLVTIFHK